ncbi:MAG: glycerophosphodiester phosphodiesterase family protein [Dysosmobacter sp.]
MPVVIVLLVLIVLAELFLLMLRCRREHPGWKLLRQYRYAHRGYHDKPHIPENSMAAFRRAIEHGYGAELDVHLMKDGRLAVIHDASLKRTAGADVLVEDLTAEELKQYRLEGTQEQIPLLEEVLPLFQGKRLIIELKAGGQPCPAGGGHLHHVGPVPGELLHRVLRPPVHPVAEKASAPDHPGPAVGAVPAPRGVRRRTRKAYHVAAGESADQRGYPAGFHRLSVLRPGESVPAAVP